MAIPLYSDNALGYQPEEAVSLAPLAELDIPEYDAGQAAADLAYTSIPLPLDDKFPSTGFWAGRSRKTGWASCSAAARPKAATWCAAASSGGSGGHPTGQAYSLSGGDSVTLSDGTSGRTLHLPGLPLTAADLPWLELEVSYQVDKVLSDAPFSLAFTADLSSALALDIQTSVDLDGMSLSLTELRLSALDVSFTADNGIGDLSTLSDQGIAPVLTMADGSQIATVWQGGSGAANGPCSAHFQPVGNDGNRISRTRRISPPSPCRTDRLDRAPDPISCVCASPAPGEAFFCPAAPSPGFPRFSPLPMVSL